MLEGLSQPAQVLRDGVLNQQPARSHVTAYLWSTTMPISVGVQGPGPWRGLGRRPNLPVLPPRQMVRAYAHNSPTAPLPRSGFVLGWRTDIDHKPAGVYSALIPDPRASQRCAQ